MAFVRELLALVAVTTLVAGQCPGAPYGTPPADFSPVPELKVYEAALTSLDLDAVVADLETLMRDSQECWPADYGNYGPLFVRLAWHCSGSYRETDGHGGCSGGRQRFEPERSWDDNTNLDKARALLWPVKQKYGDGLSWGDLFTLAGTVAIRSMGGPVVGYCAGRLDSPDGTDSLDLGPSPQQQRLAPCAVNGKCTRPLGSTTIGLIYLNPEGPVVQGPDGKWAPNPDPASSARDVRDAFGRMGMNDSETVALIGGGHAFGKAHGACPLGPGPSPLEDPVNPWPGKCGNGKGQDAFTSGIEGPWTTQPTEWDNEFFKVLRNSSWEKHLGPGGHWQWRIAGAEAGSPLAGVMRLTSDVALLHDASFAAITERFAEDPSAFDAAFEQAWFKLTTDGGMWSKAKKCIKLGRRTTKAQPTAPMRGDDMPMQRTGIISV